MLSKNEIAAYFVYGKWTKDDVKKARQKGHITLEDEEKILALKGSDDLERFQAN